MPKITAINKALKFAKRGDCLRDKAILFQLGLINQIDYRRYRVRNFITSSLKRRGDRTGLLRFKIAVNGKYFAVVCRTDDLADYQSIWECFGDMYEVPPFPVEYVFDGGGNLGLFTLVAIARLQPSECIIVEPDPANFALLQCNLSLFKEVRGICAALADEDGVAEFERLSSNAGYIKRLALSTSDRDSIATVTTRRLPALFPSNWNPESTWLKLDIEGAEYAVVRDMFASGIKPAFISAELHTYSRSGGADLITDMRENGYRVEVRGSDDEGDCRQIHACLIELGK